MALVVESGPGPVAWTGATARVDGTAPGGGRHPLAQHRASRWRITCRAKMEFDGCINYRLTLKALEAVDVRDIRLEIPYRREVAAYMMGFCRRGGYRPGQWQWD